MTKENTLVTSHGSSTTARAADIDRFEVLVKIFTTAFWMAQLSFRALIRR